MMMTAWFIYLSVAFISLCMESKLHFAPTRFNVSNARDPNTHLASLGDFRNSTILSLYLSFCFLSPKNCKQLVDGGNVLGERRWEERDYVQEVKCAWQDAAGTRKHSEHWKAISWGMLRTSTLQVRTRDWVWGEVCVSFNGSGFFSPVLVWMEMGGSCKTNIKHPNSYSAANKANNTSRCCTYIFIYILFVYFFRWLTCA